MIRLALVALVLALSVPVAAQERAPLAVHTVAVRDVTLAYRDVGQGPPLLLVHGFGGCADNWTPFLDVLAARHRVIVVDLRGHGHSTHPDGPFSMAEAGADLLSLVDALGLPRVRALGGSAGGMTLLHAARAAPERFERLAIVGVGTHFLDETAAWVRETTLETLPPPVAAEFRACAARGEAQAADLAAHFASFADAAGPDPLAPRDLAAVTVPTLLVHGDRDLFFPVDQIAALYATMPDARLWVVPGGEHVPFYDPALPVIPAVEAFLAGDATAAPDDQAADHAAIEGAVARWATAWETRDAALAARDYADDADWTNAFGQTARGRAAIERQLAEVFGLGFVMAGQSQTAQQDIRFAGPDHALVRTVVARAGQQTPDGGALGTRHTTHLRVFERRGGAWVIASHLISDARDTGAPRP